MHEKVKVHTFRLTSLGALLTRWIKSGALRATCRNIEQSILVTVPVRAHLDLLKSPAGGSGWPQDRQDRRQPEGRCPSDSQDE